MELGLQLTRYSTISAVLMQAVMQVARLNRVTIESSSDSDAQISKNAIAIAKAEAAGSLPQQKQLRPGSHGWMNELLQRA
jgi:hypothetical protein